MIHSSVLQQHYSGKEQQLFKDVLQLFCMDSLINMPPNKNIISTHHISKLFATLLYVSIKILFLFIYFYVKSNNRIQNFEIKDSNMHLTSREQRETNALFSR